jgi:hypothetical protein
MLFSKALAVKAGTVVALGGLAVGGVAATANASTGHKVKELTEILDHVSPTRVNHNHPHGAAWITGQLLGTGQVPHNQITGQKVYLVRLEKNGTWKVTQPGHVTGRLGKVRFFVHYVKHGATFELVFRGSKNFAASRSHPIDISAS